MFFSSSIREMSMRFSKYVSRMASIGTRLCPPARILASSPNSPSIWRRLGDGVGPVVGECGGFHDSSRATGPPAAHRPGPRRVPCACGAPAGTRGPRRRRPAAITGAYAAWPSAPQRLSADRPSRLHPLRLRPSRPWRGRWRGARRADPPSSSASRFLANWPIRLVDTSASTPRPNCAALPEMVRSVVMTTWWRRPRPSAGR